jgi:hypothetical protein
MNSAKRLQSSRESIMDAYASYCEGTYPDQESKSSTLMNDDDVNMESYTILDAIHIPICMNSAECCETAEVVKNHQVGLLEVDKKSTDYRDRAFYAEAALEILQQHVFELNRKLSAMKGFGPPLQILDQHEHSSRNNISLVEKKEIERVRSMVKSSEKVLRVANQDLKEKMVRIAKLEQELATLSEKYSAQSKSHSVLETKVTKLSTLNQSINVNVIEVSRRHRAQCQELVVKLRARSIYLGTCLVIMFIMIAICLVMRYSFKSIIIPNLDREIDSYRMDAIEQMSLKEEVLRKLSMEVKSKGKLVREYDDLILQKDTDIARLKLELQHSAVNNQHHDDSSALGLTRLGSDDEEEHFDGPVWIALQKLMTVDRIFSATWKYRQAYDSYYQSASYDLMDEMNAHERDQLRLVLSDIFLVVLDVRGLFIYCIILSPDDLIC